MMQMFAHSLCDHKKPHKIATIDDVNIYLADEDCPHYIDFDAVVLNCSAQSHYGDLPDNLLKHHMHGFIEWTLAWKDGSFPPVNPKFWTEILSEVKANSCANLVIHCKAGHGRTGTAACAILIANNKITPAAAASFVRNKFCESCVETSSQTSYLGWIAENFQIKNDSEEIIPSFFINAGSAAPPVNVDAEIGPPNFDWD